MITLAQSLIIAINLFQFQDGWYRDVFGGERFCFSLSLRTELWAYVHPYTPALLDGDTEIYSEEASTQTLGHSGQSDRGSSKVMHG